MNAIGIDLSEGSYAGAAAVKAMLARGEEFNLPWTLACDTTCMRCLPRPIVDMDRIRISALFAIVYPGRFDVARLGAKELLRESGWVPQRT
jgi:hypothetical protein